MCRKKVVSVLLAGVSGCLVSGFAIVALHGMARAQDVQKTPVALKVIVIEAPLRATGGKDELLKAGGKVLLEPFLRTLDGMPAELADSKTVNYSILTGDKSNPTREGKVTIGLNLKAIPHVNVDGSIQLEVDITDTELAAGGPPATTRQGFFNSQRLTDGNLVRFGSWAKDSKLVTVFASATIPGTN
jgi:hypothetical protein